MTLVGGLVGVLATSPSWELVAVAVAVVAGGWVLWSEALAKRSITSAIVLVAASAVLFDLEFDVSAFELRSEQIRVLAEVALAVVLFNDAAGLDVRELLAIKGLALRLLGIGLPLTLALSFGAAWLLFPAAGLWVCLLIAACTSPTDAALGAPIMGDERIPEEIREGLNVESGLNDGICTPIVNVALAGAIAALGGETGWEVSPLREVAIGLAVGVVGGLVLGRLVAMSHDRGWSKPEVLPIATPLCALLCYGVAVELSGNGFVAAFVAGLAFATQRHVSHRDVLGFSERTGTLLSLVVWFAVGAILVQVLGDLTWQAVAYAVIALTVARMVPVALALLGSGLSRPTVVLVGWFGPRGLASVVFAVLAYNQLPGAPGDTVVMVVITTVLLSVLAHGLSAVPLVKVLTRGHPADATA